MALLSRYAECMFWFGRYTERSACLARVLEVQASFSRGGSADGNDWGWIVRLYDDWEHFTKAYSAADAKSVIHFYAGDRNNPGSIISSVHAARENARTLRAMISTDLWLQVNSFYNKFRTLPEQSLSASKIAHTCEMVKKEAYAQLGVADATMCRDAAWHFFMFGVLIERADQMSRLLDVRFMQQPGAKVADEPAEQLGDYGFWSVLLRSAASLQAFLRVAHRHRDAETVARFLIFSNTLPRSISYCASELEFGMNQLRSRTQARSTSAAHKRIDELQQTLARAQQDPKLIEQLHDFNDTIQRHLIDLSDELAYTFFDAMRPASPEPAQSQSSPAQTQSQTQSQGPA